MRSACWKPKATDTHSEYVILAFLRKHWLRERVKIVTFYTQYLAMAVVKGKGQPRTGYAGPEGKQRYSPTLSLALDVVGLSPRLCRFTPP
jgi:hypothetical protein